MEEILEIFTAVLAVFGGYSLIGRIRDALLFPGAVRKTLRAAVIFTDMDALARAAGWAASLRRDGKISQKRLIILMKDDIIEADESADAFGEVCRINYCKETNCERTAGDSRERA